RGCRALVWCALWDGDRLSMCFFYRYGGPRALHSFPTRRSSDLLLDHEYTQHGLRWSLLKGKERSRVAALRAAAEALGLTVHLGRSEEHTSELQSRENLVCRLLLEKKKQTIQPHGRHNSTQPSHL